MVWEKLEHIHTFFTLNKFNKHTIENEFRVAINDKLDLSLSIKILGRSKI